MLKTILEGFLAIPKLVDAVNRLIDVFERHSAQQFIKDAEATKKAIDNAKSKDDYSKVSAAISDLIKRS